MDDSTPNSFTLPQQQRAIQSKCVHPTGTFIPFPNDALSSTITQLFERQVRLHPNQLAIASHIQNVTYDELNRAANQLAHAILKVREIQPDNIALLLDLGPLQTVAILAVLKAAKSYVPLDPNFPHKRLAYMVEDSQAQLLITETATTPLAATLSQKIPVINLNALESDLPEHNPSLPCSPEDLAYILYTSGSTGHPKGFSQTHRNVIVDARNLTNTIHLCCDDRLLQISSYSFSGAVRTLYGALFNGAALFPYDVIKEGLTSLEQFLIGNEITIFRSVPTLFRHFSAALTTKPALDNIRLIYLGGEPVYKNDLTIYHDCFPDDCIFLMGMGTGEAGTFALYFMDKQTEIVQSKVPVGYELPDKEILLLDGNHKPVPPGCQGAIAVRSNYLSPGYWSKPDLTQKTFLQDPENSSKRIYLTGDLGQIDPDGCLNHLGRKDFQANFSGIRIETAEIECALLEHKAIKEVVVHAREARPGEQRLIAYIIPTPDHTINTLQLRHTLQTSLPNHMLPQHYVILEALPLGATGKVDRLALPPPSRKRPPLENHFVAPRTPIEIKLAAIWAHLLDLEEVGITDVFFELGGHSLMATQIISRVIQDFHVKIPLQILFEKPTIAQMADAIYQHQADQTDEKYLQKMLVELEQLTDKEARNILNWEIQQEKKRG